jgi:hypothetical protein
MQNSQSVEKFPLGGLGAGTPFLIVGNSLARPGLVVAVEKAVAVQVYPVCNS